MNHSRDSLDRPGDDSSDLRVDAALRAAFGPDSTIVGMNRCGGVLDAVRPVAGDSSRVLLRDETDAPAPVVGPGDAGLAGGVQGRYQVLGEIARGGMGVVLKGRDPDLGRDVALKVLHPGRATEPASIRRFIEEAQISGQLQHPGILPVYELGIDAELRPYFTMRLVKGRTLAALLEERTDPTVDLGHFLAVFEQVCQTVAYAHARGVIHRDLKPSNIMVGSFGEVQVVDWGLSKVLHQGAEPAGDGTADPMAWASDEPPVTTVRMTGGGSPSQVGAILGTPSYMSPEQASGEGDNLDEQADVFSLGAILCEVLTGRPPYVGSRAQILEQAAAGHLGEAFVRLDASGAERELSQLAKRCLDPERRVRPRHAGVLARELNAFLISLGTRARAAELAAAEARAAAVVERRTRRRTVGLALALGLAILAGVGLALLAEHQRRARAEHSIDTLAALFWKANWFRDQARKVPPDQLGNWEQALAHVRSTAEIVGAGVTDQETRGNLARVLDELKQEERRIRERRQRGSLPNH